MYVNEPAGNGFLGKNSAQMGLDEMHEDDGFYDDEDEDEGSQLAG